MTARVSQERLDLFLRMHGSRLTGEPVPEGPDAAGRQAGAETPRWTRVELALGSLAAVRVLLAFGESVEVLSPPQARAELARAAAEIVALYGTGAVSPASAGGRG